MIQIKPLLFLSILIFPNNIFGQKDTIKVGAFITSIYDLSLNEQCINADFWLWFNYTSDSLDPLNTVEIVNSKETEASFDNVEIKNSIIWASQKYRSNIKCNWNIVNFPFDKQEIHIEIEESDADTSTLVFIADNENSSFDSSIYISGWEITNFKIIPRVKNYNTTYGDPTLTGISSYPMVEILIEIERDGWSLFFKLFTGVYIAFLISLMVFFIDPIDVDPRFGLSVGALFAAVGNKYIVDSILPETTTITLVDKIHNLTFIFLFVSVAISVYSLYLSKKGNVKLSKAIDTYSFIVLLTSYLIINIVLLNRAY